jgi:hypothetical protein
LKGGLVGEFCFAQFLDETEKKCRGEPIGDIHVFHIGEITAVMAIATEVGDRCADFMFAKGYGMPTGLAVEDNHRHLFFAYGAYFQFHKFPI